MPLEELKDVRPPVDLPPDYFWLAIVLGALFIASLVFLARWFAARTAKQKTAPVIIRPSWEIALEEIAALEKENLPSLGKIEEYFVRLSAIIRVYLEHRFAVNAPEMTTDEFLIHVKTISVLDRGQKESLKEFLILSDMVKFARYSSSNEEMTEALSAAKRLINETVPITEPVKVKT